MKNTKFFAFIIALILPILFLWMVVFSEASAFNLMPFEIHEAISSGGASGGKSHYEKNTYSKTAGASCNC